MSGGGGTPQQTLMAIQIGVAMPYIFGYIENSTYYFYVNENNGKGYLSYETGSIISDQGPLLNDSFTEYVISTIGQAYNVEYVDVIATNEYNIGDNVPNWDEYILVRSS